MKECKNTGIQKNKTNPIYLCVSLCPLWQKKQNEPNSPIFQQISKLLFFNCQLYIVNFAALRRQNEPIFLTVAILLSCRYNRPFSGNPRKKISLYEYRIYT